MKKWKILKNKDVSPSKWFPVNEQQVELPNGTVIDDYLLSPLGSAAMVVPITKDGELCLVKQYKHGIGEVLIELPAGFKDKKETFVETAVRELEEETGILVDESELIDLGEVVNIPTKTNFVVHCFLAKDLEFNSVQKMDDNEEIELIKVSPRKAVEMVLNGEIWTSCSSTFILKAAAMYPELFT
jgi:ADP-ribose pyrophosphatase